MTVPRAYYNEIDGYAAGWLRNLIAAGLVPAGDVDERSIAEVRAEDLAGYTQCHFFTGLGGWSCALRLAGWPDDRPVWTGSCPCQPFSVAGKRRGFADDRHLWPVWRDLIAERRPAVVFGEQVASASAWLAGVRGDLEALGYAVGAVPIEAASVGAPHKRDRYWFVADADSRPGQQVARSASGDEAANGGTGRQLREPHRHYGPPGDGESTLADPDQLGTGEGRQQRGRQLGRTGGDPGARALGDSGGAGLALGSIAEVERGDVWREGPPAASAGAGGAWGRADLILGADGKARRVEPGIRLLAHGISARVAKLRALGNAIVPQAGAAFVRAYLETRPAPAVCMQAGAR